MAIKDAVYQVDNGSGFDEIHFRTKAKQVLMANGINLEEGFKCSKNNNGYTVLPNGMILQWGRKDAILTNGNGIAEGSLPLTFNWTLGIFANVFLIDGTTQYNSLFNCNGRFVNNSYFNVYIKNVESSAGTNASVFWFAVGY